MATAQVCCGIRSVVPGYDITRFQALRLGRWSLSPADLFPPLFRGMGHVEDRQRLVVQGYRSFFFFFASVLSNHCCFSKLPWGDYQLRHRVPVSNPHRLTCDYRSDK